MPKHNWGGYDDYEICFHCILHGIDTFPYFLHPSDEMQGGPISSDIKCSSCWDGEEEFGEIEVSQKEREKAGKLYRKLTAEKENF